MLQNGLQNMLYGFNSIYSNVFLALKCYPTPTHRGIPTHRDFHQNLAKSPSTGKILEKSQSLSVQGPHTGNGFQTQSLKHRPIHREDVRKISQSSGTRPIHTQRNIENLKVPHHRVHSPTHGEIFTKTQSLPVQGPHTGKYS